MRVYIGEGYSSKGTSIYEDLMWEARQLHLGGATVIRGMMGLGHIGVVQEKDNAVNHDLPVIVEAVDTDDKIQAFISVARKILGNHGLIITSDVTIVHKGEIHPAPHAEGVKNIR